ncbi:Calmodulin-related protein [Durusdinium trenchii]|uniref:Calmodulin-related protein n=1 Tax=Durusdinium trenchii TaxID=1381693 RepID=A0ABP0M3H9_9DINO
MECQLKCLLLLNAFNVGYIGYITLIHQKGPRNSGGKPELDAGQQSPTDEEINEIFLKSADLRHYARFVARSSESICNILRFQLPGYKMSKEELQGMADKMGIQLNNLCYLKQDTEEFDAYDEDRSGYIDVKELKGLLEKLGEELSEEELDQAFRELDSDGSGEIESGTERRRPTRLSLSV